MNTGGYSDADALVDLGVACARGLQNLGNTCYMSFGSNIDDMMMIIIYFFIMND